MSVPSLKNTTLATLWGELFEVAANQMIDWLTGSLTNGDAEGFIRAQLAVLLRRPLALHFLRR